MIKTLQRIHTNERDYLHAAFSAVVSNAETEDLHSAVVSNAQTEVLQNNCGI